MKAPKNHIAFTKRPSRQAMSLIEVVISIAIVSFAIIPLLGLLGMGLTSSTAANEDLAQAAIISYMPHPTYGKTNLVPARLFRYE